MQFNKKMNGVIIDILDFATKSCNVILMLSSLYAYDLLSHVVNFYDTYLIISKTVYRGKDTPLKELVFYQNF